MRVRQAIAKAIDYQALRDKILNHNATLLNGLIPPGVPGYDPKLPEPRRDLAGAKALLTQAGYAKGIDVTMAVGQVGPVAQLIQSNLGDAGVRLTLQRLAPSAFDDARTSGAFDILYDGWVMDFPDPFIFLNLAFSVRRPAARAISRDTRVRKPRTFSTRRW